MTCVPDTLYTMECGSRTKRSSPWYWYMGRTRVDDFQTVSRSQHAREVPGPVRGTLGNPDETPGTERLKQCKMSVGLIGT